MKYKKESDLKAQILSYLCFRKIFAWPQRNVGVWNVRTGHYIPSQIKGIPDVLGILPGGRFLGIEVKRPGNYPTPHQAAFLMRIREAGGIAFIAHSVLDVEKNLAGAGLPPLVPLPEGGAA